MKRFFDALQTRIDGLQRFPCRQKVGVVLA
jgi:hypothetical protein